MCLVFKFSKPKICKTHVPEVRGVYTCLFVISNNTESLLILRSIVIIFDKSGKHNFSVKIPVFNLENRTLCGINYYYKCIRPI